MLRSRRCCYYPLCSRGRGCALDILLRGPIKQYRSILKQLVLRLERRLGRRHNGILQDGRCGRRHVHRWRQKRQRHVGIWKDEKKAAEKTKNKKEAQILIIVSDIKIIKYFKYIIVRWISTLFITFTFRCPRYGRWGRTHGRTRRG